MTDGTKKKITMPAWHIPYLEKHNIYKLFYELARELVIQQPDDHVFFIKYLLANALKNIHIPHVILLGSPRINILEVGKEIASQTKQVMITQTMIYQVLNARSDEKIKTSQYILGLQSIMNNHAHDIMKYGWLLVDCIKNKKQAQKLLDIGILATHVLYLISPYSPKLTDLLYCNVSVHWPDYRRAIYGIKEVYQKKLIEVHLQEYLIEDVVNMCMNLINIEKIESGPKQPRVVLLGPRGCGRKTQAKLLQTKLNIIHIDFEYLLCQAWISQTDIGNQLRSQGDSTCFHSELLAQVLNKRLLDADCLKNGWVLTGYPFCVNDFKYIDFLETPPNRVIFLECDLNLCHERITTRRLNVHTGSVNMLDMEIGIDDITAKVLKLHPKDKSDIINAELQYYCTQYGALRKYSGGTACVVNADQPEKWVHESITAIIIRDLPITTPRDPFEGMDEENIDLKTAMPYKYFVPD